MSSAMAASSLPVSSSPSASPSATPSAGLPVAPAPASAPLDVRALGTGPPGDSGAPPGASPPTDAFASVLTDHVARTARAEGQKESSPKTSGRRSDDQAAATAGSASTSTDVPTASVATAEAAVAVASPPLAATPDASQPRATTAGDGAPPAAAVALAPTVAHRDPHAGDTAAQDTPDGQPSPPDGKPGPAPALPSTTVAKPSGPASKTAPAAAAAAPVLAAAKASAATSPAAGVDGGPRVSVSASPARPLPTALPTTYGVRLAQAAETVRTTIAMAARQGSSSARIQLSPASLGGLQIHLQRTADGIVARVIADHPEAAQTLAQHGDELRRSLAQAGTTLLALDIESSDRRDTAARQQPGAGESSARGSGPAGEDDGTVDGVTEAVSTVTSTHDLSDTALINVLA